MIERRTFVNESQHVLRVTFGNWPHHPDIFALLMSPGMESWVEGPLPEPVRIQIVSCPVAERWEDDAATSSAPSGKRPARFMPGAGVSAPSGQEATSHPPRNRHFAGT